MCYIPQSTCIRLQQWLLRVWRSRNIQFKMTLTHFYYSSVSIHIEVFIFYKSLSFYLYPLFQLYWFLNEVTKVNLVFSAVEVIVACLMSCLACLMKSNPVCHGVWCNVPLSLGMQCWDKVHVPFPVIIDNPRPFFCFAILGKLFLGVIKYKQLLPKQLLVFTSIRNTGSFSFIPRDLIR